MRESITSIIVFEGQFRGVFEVLKEDHIPEQDHDLVLFVMSLIHDGIISRDLLSSSEGILNRLNKVITSSSKYAEIYQAYEKTLSSIHEQNLLHIFKVLMRIYTEEMEQMRYTFPQFFDKILYQVIEPQRRYNGGLQTQPKELTNIINTLSFTMKGSKVFNPFAGLASLGTSLNKSCNYIGQELNIKTWALGSLRLLAYGKEAKSFSNRDSTKNWPKEDKFDRIVSHPPFGFRLPKDGSISQKSFNTAEQAVIVNGLESLRDSGKLISVVSPNFLFASDKMSLNIRKRLVKEDLLDSIILLPAGLLSYTSVPLAILVLDKNKRFADTFRFIDARSFVNSSNQKKKILKDDELIDIIIRKGEDSDFVRIVDHEKIRNFNYNLEVPRYFLKDVEGVRLGDILEYMKGQKVALPNLGRLIRIRDLKNSNVDFLLESSEIEKIILDKTYLKKIDAKCLLIAARWNSLKPTFFTYREEAIFINQDIFCFKVDETRVDIEYLVNELHSDYIEQQVDSLRRGVTIPALKREDFLSVIIKLPSLQEQRAKVQGIQQLSRKVEKLEKERNNLIQGAKSKLYESIASIEHALGTPLMNIGSSLRNIETGLDKLDVDWRNLTVNRKGDTTVNDSFEFVYKKLELINSLISSNELDDDLRNATLYELDFLTFIEEYVKVQKSILDQNITVDLFIHPDIKHELGKTVIIKSNQKLLDLAFDVIIENAKRHAFVDIDQDYSLEFRISLYYGAVSKEKLVDETEGRFESYLKIEVANNGKPFPKNYTVDKLVRKNSFAGETGNTGQGGYDLNEIIKCHNDGISTLELLNDDVKQGFKTIYSFLIPLNK